ncbi:TrkH family potassium uptake protein [Penaeicola halotolerans]|uniref:TrkH family potassium uptake protein n=1 Tax=Penaeicola halotolerans TaxID=2793196 RepID=UPI001CF8FD07|nr:potassium transporter TrkG [Penaeicola halotolerans]
MRKLTSKIKSQLNLLLYNSKPKVERVIVSLRGVVAILAFSILIYLFGFEPKGDRLDQLYILIRFLIGFSVINVFIRWFYSFQRKNFYLNHKFEIWLAIIILTEVILSFGFDISILKGIANQLNIADYRFFFTNSILITLVVILLYEFVKASTLLSALKLTPPTIFVLSFLIIILIGTGLLMMPAMTYSEEGMPWLSALFTATSATCVTGLIVVDTATYFTFKGQIVILLLIQIGGLGIVSFATFFAKFVSKGVGLRHQSMIQNFLSSESLFDARNLLKQIINITILIEALCAIGIYLTWSPEVSFTSWKQKVYFSVFHSISGFCNAGFSLFSNGLYETGVNTSYMLHLVVVFGVIAGGLGFHVMQDLFSPQKLRERLHKPWLDWQINTKIAVYTSAALLLIGTLGIWFLEKDNTLVNLNFLESGITAFFQSGITRSAGFNTVDIGAMAIPTLILMMFLMFIGASSGSVGGGIKTSTFYLMLASTLAAIRGKSRVEIGNREIPTEILFKALSVFVFAAFLNTLAVFMLTITEPDIPLIELMFEQISAFATVGLSTGITAELSEISQVIIIVSMFLGRVGTLTFALVFSSRVISNKYQYPKAHLMVG